MAVLTAASLTTMASEATRLADFMYGLRVSGYVYGAALTILAYETATNFTREIDLLLLRKRRPVYSCSIVLVLRWLPLAGMILAWVNNPPSICKFSIVTDQILYVFVCLAIALFGALRVCGLSEGKLKVALPVLVFLLTGVPGLSNLIIIARSTYTFLGPPFDTCLQQPIDSTRTITIISWVAGIATFSGNTLILVVTWKKSFQQWRRCKGCGIRMSLSELLLRDGTLYFVIIGAMDLIQIVLISLQTTTSTATSIQPFLQVFVSSLSYFHDPRRSSKAYLAPNHNLPLHPQFAAVPWERRRFYLLTGNVPCGVGSVRLSERWRPRDGRVHGLDWAGAERCAGRRAARRVAGDSTRRDMC